MKKKVLLLGVLAILSTVAFGEIVDTNEIGVWNELDSNAFFEIEENQETQKIIEVGEETMGTDFSLEGEVTTELEIEQPQKIIEVGEETIGTFPGIDGVEKRSIEVESEKYNDEIKNSKRTSDNTTGIKENSERITKNTENIKENKSNIKENESNIEINSNRIADNSGRIDRVESKVQSLENEMNRGFAMAAATSSIVYPALEKGDLGIGAGVGGYSNSQAVALGVAMQPAENFRVNANVSTSDGSDAMYGAGVGYKFNMFN